MKLGIALVALLINSAAQAYEAQPTKKDLIDFYAVMKLLYSDMSPVMNGMGILIEADFQLDRIKDKQAICDMVQSIERMEYIASTAKVHPEYRDTLKEFNKIKKEDIDIVKRELQKIGHKCI